MRERQKPVARNPSFIVMNVLECTLTTCTCLDLRSEIVKDLEIFKGGSPIYSLSKCSNEIFQLKSLQ